MEPIVVEKFLQGLKTDGKSARTINHYRADIVAFVNWATRTGRIRNHSLSIIPKLNEHEDRRRVRRALTPEELRRFLEVAAEQDEANKNYFPRYPVYLTAAMTGLRRNELKHLIWADIDFENQTLRVRMNVAKAKREDIIPLHGQVIDALAKIKPDNGRASGNVFNTMPTILTFYKDIVRAREKWINEATTDQEKEIRQESDFLAKKDSEGRVVDLHALRTTLGTNLALNGVAPQIAQRIMRHSDYRTTLAHYTALRTADTVEAINSLPGVG
ncbi:Tyrosine recombinase XerC [subsurface metagenome]